MSEVIRKYGLELVRLGHDKIELVRKWRNDRSISQYMEYREYISPEAQELWFSKIDNAENYYFIITFQNEDIGLIDIKDVDFSGKQGEAGIFIWDERYLNSDVSFRAAFALFDFAFDDLKLNRIISHVLSDNKRAIQFNKLLGFKLLAGQDNVYNQEYNLDISDYIRVKDRYMKYFL